MPAPALLMRLPRAIRETSTPLLVVRGFYLSADAERVDAGRIRGRSVQTSRGGTFTTLHRAARSRP